LTAIEVAERSQVGHLPIHLTRHSSAFFVGDVHFSDSASIAPLPFSGQEITEVASYFEQPHVGRKTTPNRAWVLDKLAQTSVAHFATHGIGRTTVRILGQGDSPLLADAPFLGSGLLIAGDSPAQASLLTAATITNLQLPQLKLVVLSACESAVGGGDERGFALPRAFHLAGAQAVVSTQWPVDDQATAVLMKLFYANLLEHKMQPAEAIRQAQLTVYRHPDQVDRLAQMRGPDFSKAAQKLRKNAAAAATRDKSHSSPRLWAGFLVSRGSVVDGSTDTR
jgi:CHAT domain-containing protein